MTLGEHFCCLLWRQNIDECINGLSVQKYNIIEIPNRRLLLPSSFCICNHYNVCHAATNGLFGFARYRRLMLLFSPYDLGPMRA